MLSPVLSNVSLLQAVLGSRKVTIITFNRVLERAELQVLREVYVEEKICKHSAQRSDIYVVVLTLRPGNCGGGGIVALRLENAHKS